MSLEQRVEESDCQTGGLNLKGKEEQDWRKRKMKKKRRDVRWREEVGRALKNHFSLISNSFYHHLFYLPFLMHN